MYSKRPTVKGTKQSLQNGWDCLAIQDHNIVQMCPNKNWGEKKKRHETLRPNDE